VRFPGSPSPRRILRLGENLEGRDFVVGDIHGAFDLVDQALAAVAFDPAVDRLLSVGDLIDRGAGSARVLEFLARDYVYAVRGNHEQVFVSMPASKIRAMADIDRFGMGWVREVSPAQLEAIVERLRALPLVIEIAGPLGMVGLVHAEVPVGMNWGDFTAAIERRDPLVTLSALDGRVRVDRESRDTSGVAGIDRLFVGHSVQWDGPLQLGNVFVIDTGAVYAEQSRAQESWRSRGALTIANILCSDESLTSTAINQQRLIVVDQEGELALEVCTGDGRLARQFHEVEWM